MNCFNHETGAAVALCKNCGKSLCTECAIDTGFGIACKGKCEAELKAVNDLVMENRKRVKQFNNFWKPKKILSYVLIAIILFVALRYWVGNHDMPQPDAPAGQSLEDRIEKGIYSAFPLDTLLYNARKIYFDYDFNELSCAWLIKLLMLMDSRDGNKPIDLYLCSNGGYVSEAKAVSNAIRTLRSKVNTIATGYCASSALRVLASGTGTRAAFCNTIVMFHGAEYSEVDKPHSYDAVAKDLELKEWKSMTKLTDRIILDTAEYNLSAKEALEMGFIDTILCPEMKNKAVQ